MVLTLEMQNRNEQPEKTKRDRERNSEISLASKKSREWYIFDLKY